MIIGSKPMICNICGGISFKEDTSCYICKACKAQYEKSNFDDICNKLKDTLDKTKLENLSNLRSRLYQEIRKEYIDSDTIQQICNNILNILPEDNMASFFYVANDNKPNLKEVAKFIHNINKDKNPVLAKLVLEFLIKSPNLWSKKISMAISQLLEDNFTKSGSEYQELFPKICDMYKKIDEGVFDVSIDRDAFIAYSSDDEDKVVELVETLENNGISCFVSVRNLQHGSGAIRNYVGDLQVAMNNCKFFIFVSSTNSRTKECDAYDVELKYIRELERKINKKKPKIEYVIEEYSEEESVVDTVINNFFEGLERVYNPKDVALRIEESDNSGSNFESEIQTNDKIEGLYKQIDAMKEELQKTKEGKKSSASNLKEAQGSQDENITIDSNIKIGNTIKFGCYRQSAIKKDKTPIEWFVIDRTDKAVLLVSKYVIDCKPFYAKSFEEVTWKACSLRWWLNKEFFDQAFSLDEQKKILVSKSSQGDKVFVLSIDEAKRYFSSCKDRECASTKYAKKQGAKGIKHCCWWLRDDFNSSIYAPVICSDGTASHKHVEDNNNGVRPALWINIDN